MVSGVSAVWKEVWGDGPIDDSNHRRGAHGPTEGPEDTHNSSSLPPQKCPEGGKR